MSWSFSAGICLCNSWCPLARKVCVLTWLRITCLRSSPAWNVASATEPCMGRAISFDLGHVTCWRDIASARSFAAGCPSTYAQPSQLDLVLSVLDFVNPGSMLLVRSGIIGDLTGEITFNNLVGTSLSVSSLSYVGLTLPVFALAQVGFLLVARSFTCLGPASLALDSLQLSAPLSPRSLA